MQIPQPPMPLSRMQHYRDLGYWSDTISPVHLAGWARKTPDRVALIDPRSRLTFAQYHHRVRRLAAHFLKLGLTKDDVIAIQLPNWNEFAVAVNAAMLVGIPFCQFHSDFRSREVGFILDFTKASTLIAPVNHRGFDYPGMIAGLKTDAPHLKHVMLVGDAVPVGYFDLRDFLDHDAPLEASDAAIAARLPAPTDLQRTAFTSGTTGHPKAVLHIHIADDAGVLPSMRHQKMDETSVLLVFLPVGLNWGFHNVMMGAIGGVTLVLLDVFRAEEVARLIERERVTHFGAAPAHLVSLLGLKNLADYDLSSLQVYLTGGASCPVELIREARAKLPGQLLELYGMLEAGTIALTSLDDDPEMVAGLVGRPWWQAKLRVIDEHGDDCGPGGVGEIIMDGPALTIGYYNNPQANAESFTPDGWFHTGDLGVLDAAGYLKIVGRKKDMIIRGGANIYPREIEEVLHEHPAIRDVAVIGVPDERLGERVCACVVTKDGARFTYEDMISFLGGRISNYKLPELLTVLADLPRTPTGKVQKAPLRDIVIEKLARGEVSGRTAVAS